MQEFTGPAIRLMPQDIADAAKLLGVSPGVIQAVRTVEVGPGSGFLADGRPRILFEALHFGNATGHRYDAAYPSISIKAPNNWRLYRDGAPEYARMQVAIELDRKAALESASWGLFQILGSNAKDVGFSDVEEFVAAMVAGEAYHLRAFVKFCQVNGLAKYLVNKDWAGFAARYNGPSYAVNRYDAKLAQAYADILAGGAPRKGDVLRVGSQGSAVVQLQRALNLLGASLREDGNFGRATELAVMRAQEAAKLTVDGVAGPITRAALKVGDAT